MDGWMVCCILDSSDVSSNQEGESDFIMRWMQYVVQEERARKGSDGWNIRRGGGGWVFIDSFHRLIGKKKRKRKKKKKKLEERKRKRK